MKATPLQIEQRQKVWLNSMDAYLQVNWPKQTHEAAKKVLQDFADKNLADHGYQGFSDLKFQNLQAYPDGVDPNYIANSHTPKLKLKQFEPKGWLKMRHESSVFPTDKNETLDALAYDPLDLKLSIDETALKECIVRAERIIGYNEVELGEYKLKSFMHEAARAFERDVIQYLEATDEKRHEIDKSEAAQIRRR